MNPSCLVFKYCGVNANSLAALHSGKVWFANRDQLNDPYDCTPKIVRDIDDNQADELLNSFDAHFSGKPSFDDKLRIIEDSLFTLAGQCGVFCVSPTPYDELMWSHYADAHRGIAIGYGVKKRNVNNRCYPHQSPREVDYTGRGRPCLSDLYKARMQGPDSNCAFNNLINQIYFSKTAAWSYEREFRFLSVRENGLRELDADIVMVIYGARTPIEHISLIQRMLPDNVVHFQMELGDDGILCERTQA